MPSRAKSGSASTYVTIVSNNPETLDGLRHYLEHAGVPAHSTRAIHDFTMVAPGCATATVIFPDDFEEGAVVALVHELRRKRPRLSTVLVTRSPDRFRSVLYTEDRSLTPIVLPRPSFGWDILDAIRTRDEATEGRAS